MARYDITNGPSKWDLILALSDGDYHHRREISFSLQGISERVVAGFTLQFLINELQREDRSGENWNFRGTVPAFPDDPCHGFFSTKTRKGWIKTGE